MRRIVMYPNILGVNADIRIVIGMQCIGELLVIMRELRFVNVL